jgi:CHAT domain-containing protein/Tfp pilus assembly protein PilF
VRMRTRATVLTFALVLSASGPLFTSGEQAPAAQVTPAERAAQLQAKLAEAEKTAGPNDPAVATVLNEFAIFHFTQGEFAAAEPLLRRAVAIREKALGPEHPHTSQALNNLAQVLQALGRYAEVEPLLERALAIYEKTQGPEHPDVATALNNLAGLHRLTGNYPKAEPLYRRALAIGEKTSGPDSPAVAAVVNNLGLMHQQAGELTKARPLLERSLAIREKAAPDTPDVARALNNLGILVQEEGSLARAEELYRRAAAIFEKAHGRTHPLTGQTLNNLAVVLLLKKEYDEAGTLYDEAIRIRRSALGASHPDLTLALTSEAIYFDVIGRMDDAVLRQAEAAEITERNLDLILATGSEAQKARYMETFTENTDITISMHRESAPGHPGAQHLALTTILRRKGRVLDALSDIVQVMRSRATGENRESLDRLAAARSQLARRVLRGPGGQPAEAFNAEIQKLQDDLQQLEREISTQSAAFRSQAASVTIESVRKALPADAALIEFSIYRPFVNTVAVRHERFKPSRYVAYVLKSTGEPASTDLGDIQQVDALVEDLRRALANPKATGLAKAARALHDSIIAPLAPLLGDTQRLFVSPDGALNLVPFAALADTSGRYLVETREISYLTSGRDLLGHDERASESSRPLIVANPQFDVAGTAEGRARDKERSFDLSRARFTPLPGTAAEAKALAALLTDAEVLTGARATETALKTVKAPRVLHLATHGFFLGTGVQGPAASRLLKHEAADAATSGMLLYPALLRSGLAFAGANRPSSATADDGILTALEAASLDLWGTRLAVLSACETGLGEARRGEGVYGLRRALVIAGAESQMMSLWQVSDQGTRALMTDFYTTLKSGRARSAALRDVQLRMLKSKNRSHPYYWASFILSGADGPVTFQ